MNSGIILPKLNYEKLTYDQVFCHFYGRKFTLVDLNTLEGIINHHKEINPDYSEERERLESWHSSLRKGFAMRGEL